ncbi:hypothetical protein E2320_012233 [Naja naja]|nr:hypothetical protein E2320_012233 [Naja naja]
MGMGLLPSDVEDCIVIVLKKKIESRLGCEFIFVCAVQKQKTKKCRALYPMRRGLRQGGKIDIPPCIQDLKVRSQLASFKKTKKSKSDGIKRADPVQASLVRDNREMWIAASCSLQAVVFKSPWLRPCWVKKSLQKKKLSLQPSVSVLHPVTGGQVVGHDFWSTAQWKGMCLGGKGSSLYYFQMEQKMLPPAVGKRTMLRGLSALVQSMADAPACS